MNFEFKNNSEKLQTKKLSKSIVNGGLVFILNFNMSRSLT